MNRKKGDACSAGQLAVADRREVYACDSSGLNSGWSREDAWIGLNYWGLEVASAAWSVISDDGAYGGVWAATLELEGEEFIVHAGTRDTGRGGSFALEVVFVSGCNASLA